MRASAPGRIQISAAAALLFFPTGIFSFVRRSSTSTFVRGVFFSPWPYDENRHCVPRPWTHMTTAPPLPMPRPPASPSARLGDVHGQDAALGGAAPRGGACSGGRVFRRNGRECRTACVLCQRRDGMREERESDVRRYSYRQYWMWVGGCVSDVSYIGAETNRRCTLPRPSSPSTYTSTSVSTPTSPTYLAIPRVSWSGHRRPSATAASQSHCTPPTKPPHSANATLPAHPRRADAQSHLRHARAVLPCLIQMVVEYCCCDNDHRRLRLSSAA
ncbi:hypothetical protein C8R45DRAFT_558871 [Mycena sanguinolenta]|nr:hypothetical protein C8R45DRAFT_558871 [Mycena sanguinolenta]